MGGPFIPTCQEKVCTEPATHVVRHQIPRDPKPVDLTWIYCKMHADQLAARLSIGGRPPTVTEGTTI